jgi:hypothetical protein
MDGIKKWRTKLSHISKINIIIGDNSRTLISYASHFIIAYGTRILYSNVLDYD